MNFHHAPALHYDEGHQIQSTPAVQLPDRAILDPATGY